MFPRLIRTPTFDLIFKEKNAYYTRKITVYDLDIFLTISKTIILVYCKTTYTDIVM